MDQIMKRVFSVWLSPAYLKVRRITWEDSAVLLEKIVAYEAVHPVSSLFDLKRRVGKGRRCFAYFHSSIPGEPLVFIEVALTSEICDSIQKVLADSEPVREEDSSTAVFYSISNTQDGLSGIDLGHSLISNVVQMIRQELPQIKTFATLSPIPGFLHWLIPKLHRCSDQEKVLLEAEIGRLKDVFGVEKEKVELRFREALESQQWAEDPALAQALREPIMRLCARYLLLEKKRGRAMDSVANFHVGNGASIFRLNWMADASPKGLASGAGIMVNYLYRADAMKHNHWLYRTQGRMECSEEMRKDHHWLYHLQLCISFDVPSK